MVKITTETRSVANGGEGGGHHVCHSVNHRICNPAERKLLLGLKSMNPTGTVVHRKLVHKITDQTKRVLIKASKAEEIRA